ncbi:MAG: PIN domain-containing protein [Planctomycetes bacterium]|nr:PIN domain-containing protein [Planctomycetota bacterium]
MSETRCCQFVDTNILVYAHDTSSGAKCARARELVRELWDSGEGGLSIQVLQEFYVAVTRKAPRPLSAADAARIVGDLSTWEVYCPAVHDVLDAIRVHERWRLSFWDAMIVVSARQLGCRVLWSEDLNAGQVIEGLEVRSPF